MFALCRRHVSTCSPTWERRGHNPVDGAVVCFGRPADDVIDGTAGAIVEAEGGHAHGWQWLQGRGSRGLRCCRLYRIHQLCRGLRRRQAGPDASVEEVHIVRPIYRRFEQSGEQGVGPLVLGHLRLE